MMNFDMFTRQSKDGADAVMKSFGAIVRGGQAAAIEISDFTKKSFEQGTAAVEKLSAARSLEKVVELQGEFVRSSYEGLVSQTSKLGEIATATAKETLAALEGVVSKQPA